MTFSIPQLSTDVVNEERCRSLLQSANDLHANVTSDFKNQWNRFWDPSLTPDAMQAQLDFLGSTPATDATDSAVTNALAAYFAKALRLIQWITTENPGAFADARQDLTGHYTEFLTPGWTYAIDSNGRFVVSQPCQWKE